MAVNDGSAETKVSRRESLGIAGRIVGLVVLAECVGVVALFLWPRKAKAREGGYGGVITAGPVDNFAPGQVTPFAKGQFYLVRLADGGFLALSRKCTHLGCTVPWDDGTKHFACPCHASSFDERGVVLSPPAPRPLDRYPVRIENGIVKVDTSTPILREAFDDSQVVRG
jgi:cytochrome b6-f complex iron-sulfur subunit